MRLVQYFAPVGYNLGCCDVHVLGAYCNCNTTIAESDTLIFDTQVGSMEEISGIGHATLLQQNHGNVM